MRDSPTLVLYRPLLAFGGGLQVQNTAYFACTIHFYFDSD